MHNVILDERLGFETDESEQHEPLRAVIVYDGMAAGKRAMQLLTGIVNRTGAADEFNLTPWSFSLLTDKEWCQISANDAVKADILVIAVDESLPRSILDWLESVIQQKRETSAAIVALTGTGSAHGVNAGWDTVELAALHAGLAFFKSDAEATVKNVGSAVTNPAWPACGE